jgi:hypothetical protein
VGLVTYVEREPNKGSVMPWHRTQPVEPTRKRYSNTIRQELPDRSGMRRS